MSKRWYVVHAYSLYEKKVAAAIQERAELHGLQDKFGEILVPTEEVVEMKSELEKMREQLQNLL